MEDARSSLGRITRSMTVLSEYKERDPPAIKEVFKTLANVDKSEKRPPDYVDEESSMKRMKMALHSNPKEGNSTSHSAMCSGNCTLWSIRKWKSAASESAWESAKHVHSSTHGRQAGP
ncbi:Hypothetical predicted protein [Olea europaea subsp. europaea]|uniref:Uncharacterized protein n=1 Tax=Olea europaea subsp. europaea TaxID=158383 RepID=A0A8S0R4M7_OLEEU|nr:Hypothetical predicted protein [Olea europaea subsp. europaea]